jgi:hypothetical protein
MGRATGTLSVASALLAAIDWAVNLMVAPGKQTELRLLALLHAYDLTIYAGETHALRPHLMRRWQEKVTRTTRALIFVKFS